MPTKRIYRCPYGTELLPNGSVRFRLWAPEHQRCCVQLVGQKEPLAMLPFDHGWHELITYDAKLGSRYLFSFENGAAVPDPASRFQPDDGNGPSEVIDPEAYEWQDDQWRGRPWEDAVIYEVHVGAFSEAGTFAGVFEKLPHLVSLGVTAIALMPLGDFPGKWNWGYDGTLLFAPDSSYGPPDHLKMLIDAAHALGLMIILDVVYNHFGPLGNHIASYASVFFNQARKTPWGPAINFDGEHSRPVRDFMIHNALYWLQEYHFDGLRLDAVHAIVDSSEKHLVVEIAERVRATITDRHVHLILENEDNLSRYLRRDAKPLLFSAQWNDDVHHVLHTAVSGESMGYYEEYRDDTYKLGRALAEGFAFQGEMMRCRGSQRGELSAHLPPTAFVAFIQNHDQIGNRLFGERLGHLAPQPALRAVTALYLLLPQIPMLFMGEEWSTSCPFPYFCDYEGPLAEAIRESRKGEFAHFAATSGGTPLQPPLDPTAASTFASAKLRWSEIAQPVHFDTLARYQRLLHCRREHIVPLLAKITKGGAFEIVAPQAVLVRWQAQDTTLTLAANLSAANVQFPPLKGRVIWQEGAMTNGLAREWSVCYAVGS